MDTNIFKETDTNSSTSIHMRSNESQESLCNSSFSDFETSMRSSTNSDSFCYSDILPRPVYHSKIYDNTFRHQSTMEQIYQTFIDFPNVRMGTYYPRFFTKTPSNNESPSRLKSTPHNPLPTKFFKYFQFPLSQISLRFEFIFFGLIIGLFISFLAYPLVYFFHWFAINVLFHSSPQNGDSVSHIAMSSDSQLQNCDKPKDVLFTSTNSWRHLIWFAYFTFLMIFIRFLQYLIWGKIFEKVKITIYLALKPFLFVSSVLFVGNSAIYLFQLDTNIVHIIFLLAYGLGSYWFGLVVEKTFIIPKLPKYIMLSYITYAIIFSFYSIALTPLFFNNPSSVGRLIFRLIIHPIIAECGILFFRLQSEFLASSRFEAAPNFYLNCIFPSFMFIFFGRFMIVFLDSPLLNLLTNIWVVFLDIVFRSTSWHRDFYLFSKRFFDKDPSNSSNSHYNSKIDTILTYFNDISHPENKFIDSIFSHYHLYYIDEVVNHAAIIISAMIFLYLPIVGSRGLPLTTFQILLQTIVAIVVESLGDILRCYFVAVKTAHISRKILMSSSNPFSSSSQLTRLNMFSSNNDQQLRRQSGQPDPSEPAQRTKSSFFQSFFIWWISIDTWVHTLWSFQRMKPFVPWLIVCGFTAFLSFYTSFLWERSCFLSSLGQPYSFNSPISFI